MAAKIKFTVTSNLAAPDPAASEMFTIIFPWRKYSFKRLETSHGLWRLGRYI